MNYTEYQDATALAQAIKNGEMSVVEAVQSAISQIEKHNGNVNAVVTLRAAAALEEAQQMVDLSAPFAGVPILLKDLGHDLAGLPSTFGCKLFRDNIAQRTANFTHRILEAGFIIIGQTNVPEMGFVTYSQSELFGPVRNPIDLDYTPGGSSGGAAAAIQTSMVPIATASDGGGSIRVPASYSGLIGLKPTRGRTPVGPGKWRSLAGAAVGFVLTQSVRDIKTLLPFMQSTDLANPFLVQPLTETDFSQASQHVKGLRMAYSVESPINGAVSPEAVSAVTETVAYLRSQGFTVDEAKPVINGVALMENYHKMNAAEAAVTFTQVEAKLNRQLTPADMELQSWVVYQYGRQITGCEYSMAIQSFDQAAEAMMKFHQQYDILIQPATASHAPRIDKVYHSEDILAAMNTADLLVKEELEQLYWDMFAVTLADSAFSQQANMIGSPAISLPLHTCANGLPLGVQFTAPKGREDWLIALAENFEAAGQFKYYK